MLQTRKFDNLNEIRNSGILGRKFKLKISIIYIKLGAFAV